MLSAGKNKKKDQLNEDIFNWVDVSPVTSKWPPNDVKVALYDLLLNFNTHTPLFQANVGQARCKENAFIRVLMDSIADSAIKGNNPQSSWRYLNQS